ncbi:Sm-like protein LSM6A [Vitis vinifera]|uniref:Sm-like protein LSM6A n=1 Tax=Vitis vinifera TaxID=29760 RepID=A0A438GRB7_VITVI|nr:Sm-like protein LSM6A [Vitis vinifera]
MGLLKHIGKGVHSLKGRYEYRRRERVCNHKTPADFLKSIRGRPVVVKLNSGVDYRGKSFCSFFCIAF